MAVWAITSLVSSPLSGLILVRGKQAPAMVITVTEASLRIGAVWLGARGNSPEMAVATYAAVSVLISISSVAWVLHMAEVPPRMLLNDCAPVIIALAAGLIWAVASRGWAPMTLRVIVLGMAVAFGSTVALRRLVFSRQ
jgi:hypothetical protein